MIIPAGGGGDRKERLIFLGVRYSAGIIVDIMLLRVFQRQLALQCKFLLLAAEEADRGVRQRDVDLTFYALQNVLSAAANISKALWGQRGRFATERAPLRDSIAIGDDSSLKNVAMRNNFEHFDERLEKWWNESARHSHVDLCIGAKNRTLVGVDEIDQFRSFDPETSDITFWGQDFNLAKIVDEVRRIAPKLEEEATKPPTRHQPLRA